MLPSEDRLAKDLEVSRITVREAIRTLEGRGLVRVRNGRRARVEGPSGKQLGDFFQSLLRRDPRYLLDLVEFRQAVEVHIAQMAATRASRAAIAVMQESIAEMKRTADEPERYYEADVRFHETLAGTTNSVLMIMVIEQLGECLRVSRNLSYLGHRLRGLPQPDAPDSHAMILERVIAQDARGAGAAMHRHLKETERDLRAALHAEAGGNLGPGDSAVPGPSTREASARVLRADQG